MGTRTPNPRRTHSQIYTIQRQTFNSFILRSSRHTLVSTKASISRYAVALLHHLCLNSFCGFVQQAPEGVLTRMTTRGFGSRNIFRRERNRFYPPCLLCRKRGIFVVATFSRSPYIRRRKHFFILLNVRSLPIGCWICFYVYVALFYLQRPLLDGRPPADRRGPSGVAHTRAEACCAQHGRCSYFRRSSSQFPAWFYRRSTRHRNCCRIMAMLPSDRRAPQKQKTKNSPQPYCSIGKQNGTWGSAWCQEFVCGRPSVTIWLIMLVSTAEQQRATSGCC